MGRRPYGVLVALSLAAAGCGSDGEGASDGPFCKGRTAGHLLCADFDEGPVESGWDSLDLRSGGTIDTVTEPVRSSPNAALVRASADARAVAYLVKTLQGPVTQVHVAFDLRVESAGNGDSGATILKLETSAGHQVTFNVNNAGDALGCSGAEFVAGAEPSSVVCATPLSMATWTRVDIEANYAEGSGYVVIRVGGRSEALVELPLHASLGTTFGVALGVRTYVGGGRWQVAFDNVTID
ncbi:hypothetical protein LVJ94_46680 [Pendulispora rubella]|uniref:Lipoprotein n=1 Tax=Pendulispora rubella TaxID=2741070 RepID=A0ABZ2L6R5_9BACT